MKKILRKNKKGFTLIELIIVIAILAILAAVAIPSFIGLTDQANRGKDIANATAIVTAINTYNALNVGNEFDGNTTDADIQQKLKDANLWPQGMQTAADITNAMERVDFNGKVAIVNTAQPSASASTST
jgi:prepilin-type N-terminal cleavage/methylation domain-containing protein